MSGPGDFVTFNEFKTPSICCSVILIFVSSEIKVALKSGRGSFSSLTKTELKKSFNMSAFSWSFFVRVITYEALKGGIV